MKEKTDRILLDVLYIDDGKESKEKKSVEEQITEKQRRNSSKDHHDETTRITKEKNRKAKTDERKL